MVNNEIRFSGRKDLLGMKILVLEPQPDFAYPTEIAPIWKQLLKDFKPEEGLYYLLFSKLMDYSGSDPDSLAIYFKSADPALFSFSVYKGSKIEHELISINVRDPSGGVDPGDLNQTSVGGILHNFKMKPNLELMIRSGLEKFLKSSRSGGQVRPQKRDLGGGAYQVYALNLKGEVTPGLNERIYINFQIIPAGSDRVNVAYFFSVLCAPGVFRAPVSSNEYKDALSDYKDRVDAYGSKLKEYLLAILN